MTSIFSQKAVSNTSASNHRNAQWIFSQLDFLSSLPSSLLVLNRKLFLFCASFDFYIIRNFIHLRMTIVWRSLHFLVEKNCENWMRRTLKCNFNRREWIQLMLKSFHHFLNCVGGGFVRVLETKESSWDEWTRDASKFHFHFQSHWMMKRKDI